METSEDILRRYPYFVLYKPPYREGSSWIRYPGCKDQDYLLCKNVDDIFTCIMQSYLSCIYFEKSLEYNVDSSSSFEEMMERYGELPDITEKMKVDLIDKFISAKNGLLYQFRFWPTNVFTPKFFGVDSTTVIPSNCSNFIILSLPKDRKLLNSIFFKYHLLYDTLFGLFLIISELTLLSNRSI